MTATRSAISATTPKSWVMNITAVPCRRWRSLISASTWAWVVTSSAVVGSSQISTSGASASAMAIITRWRCPPESSCGKARSAPSGSGRCTSRRAASASCSTSRGSRPRWTCHISPIWRPTRMSGLSAVIGSWNTIATRRPRSARHSSGDLARRSSPDNSMRPPTTDRPGASNPMTAEAVTDLPDPLSPTTHRISPAARVSETSSMAKARSAPRGRRTLRFSMVSRVIAHWPGAGSARRSALAPAARRPEWSAGSQRPEWRRHTIRSAARCGRGR